MMGIFLQMQKGKMDKDSKSQEQTTKIAQL